MKKRLLILFVLIMVIGIGGMLFYYKLYDSQFPTTDKTAKYYCPMHPTYMSSRPRDCPICNMKLVPMKRAERQEEVTKHPERPEVLEGRTTVSITPEKQQKIGVRFIEVKRVQLTRELNINGVIEHDETTYYKIAPRFSGWVRKLFVNYTGQNVSRDSPLMSIYSPEVYRTTSEYLIALESYERAMTTSNITILHASKELLDSATRKIGLMELPLEIINEIAANRKPLDEVIIKSPVSGHIIIKNVVEGRFFESGETLFEIGDLSNLWVRAYVYEQDYPLIKVGLKCIINCPYLKNREFTGDVDFIYPHVNEVTRQIAIRIKIRNDGELVRPGMWTNVKIKLDYGNSIAVPSSAVLDTGINYFVFVKKPDDQFEPRIVKVGFKTDEFYEITEGLRENETVVDGALFLIDSESQIKSAIMGITPGHIHESDRSNGKKTESHEHNEN